MSRPMTQAEQEDHRRLCQIVRDAIEELDACGLDDEDLAVAKARMENWLVENTGRWAE